MLKEKFREFFQRVTEEGDKKVPMRLLLLTE
jgi:hypothetical protein